MARLRWPSPAFLPPAARDALLGRHAPYELVTEPVLGHDHVVFTQRPRSLRQMLDPQAAANPDLPFLISPGRQWTYREAIADIDATAVPLGERYGVAAGDRVAIVAANHAEVEIRDTRDAVLPEGETGEIFLRTPSVFLGYWNDPAATRAVLDDDRWYRTGDFGRIAGGLLFPGGRRSDLILRGGANIYPIEIENRLIEHPDIDEAAVTGTDHPELGQEPMAFVVRRPGSGLTAGQVRDWCASALAPFKVPAAVRFRASLPCTETGKVIKHELEGEEKARRASKDIPAAGN